MNDEKYEIDQFSLGLLLGLIMGEGHFGGDGKQPQITIRMHARHENLFKWLLRLVPGSKLYGPYHHGGRHYYQWMVRGETLRKKIVPLISKTTFRYLDSYHYQRFQKMIDDYAINLEEGGGENSKRSNMI